jgi:two-component system phosphate regulon response regulator PhoB
MAWTEPAMGTRTTSAPWQSGQSGHLKMLVVEDEPAVREMVADNFRFAGYTVSEAGSVAEALEILNQELPHIILLDWMLPDSSGLELVRRLKRDENTAALPVIMLTARGEEPDRIRGLDGGADDYVTKPFSLRELESRVKAVLRRAPSVGTTTVVAVAGLSVDTERHRVLANGVDIRLGPTELRLLHALMSHPERVFSRSQLLDSAWGRDVYVEERTVDVYVRRLRKSLEPAGFDAYVQTVRGVGYRFSVAG